MLEPTGRVLDDELGRALDAAGVVGERLRAELAHDLKAKLILRGGRDRLHVVGPRGSGRHVVAEAAHHVAREILGRGGPKVRLDCGAPIADADFADALRGSLAEAEGGTLVLERYGRLEKRLEDTADNLLEHEGGDALVVTLARPGISRSNRQHGPAIRIKALHEREEDLWELIDHFYEATVEDSGVETTCRGFSRQAMADIAEAVRRTNLESVRRLRAIVRDLVFDALASGPLPLKLTSDEVRPYLEQHFGQTEAARRERDEALLDSQFESLVSEPMLARLSEIHGVPEEVLRRQAEVVSVVIEQIDDLPRSYRNIMDRSDDVLRAAIWLHSGASTQAEFRRFFGEERFMRPTKSVAWAFYNRVFKRDV